MKNIFSSEAYVENLPKSKKLQNALSSRLANLSSLPSRLAVGVSGGSDSTTLALYAKLVSTRLKFSLCLFHINHGLQKESDSWALQVRRLASMIDTPVFEKRLEIILRQHVGTEAAARDARYAAFAELARQHKISHVLLAHHCDDQAETVLLRLLRGSGVQGLSAMSVTTYRDRVMYIRPWLNIEKSHILEYQNKFASYTGWKPVQDPTNTDIRYSRAVLREKIAPILNKHWPGWRRVLARTAKNMFQAAQSLDNAAREDFDLLEVDAEKSSFSLVLFRRLDVIRQTRAVRYWLKINGLKMPTEARLRDMLRQMNQLHALGYGKNMRIKHGTYSVICRKGRIQLELC